MSRDDPQMKIRLPAELKRCIEESSTANNRTMNSEIVARLLDSFVPQPPPPPVPLDKLITEVNTRLVALEKFAELFWNGSPEDRAVFTRFADALGQEDKIKELKAMQEARLSKKE